MLLNLESYSQNRDKPKEQAKISAKIESALHIRAIALVNIIKHFIPGVPSRAECDDRVVTESELVQAARERLAVYGGKFEQLHITADEHIELFTNSFTGQMRPVKKIIEKSIKRIGHKHVKPSKSHEDNETAKQRHANLIESYIKDVPIAKDIGKEQKIIMIVGPCAAGKTEIFENYLKSKDLKSSDVVIIDLDEIRKKLATQDYDPNNQHDVQRVREESWDVSDSIAITALQQGKIVLMQTPLHRRKRWLNDKSVNYAKDNSIPIDISMILRPVTDCMTRNINRPKRSVAMKDLFESMNGMDVIIKFVQKFGNVSRVDITDFYPMLKVSQAVSPKAFEHLYRKLIAYAKSRPDLFKIYTRKSELEIYPE